MNLIDTIGPIESSDPERSHPHTTLLWGRDDLLVQAVISFLKRMAWEVIHVADMGNVDELIQEAKRVSPEVIILCQDKADDGSLPGRLIREKLCLKVIAIGLDSNVTHVYSRQDVLLQGASDLMSIIDPEYFSSCTHGKEVGNNKT